jgi:hypothetical protein
VSWQPTMFPMLIPFVAQDLVQYERVKTKEGGLLLLIRSSSGIRLRFALILALVLLASAITIPAVAQTDQESDQEGESGESDQSGEVSNLGDNSNQCVAVMPVSNTGNAITDLDILIQLPTGEQRTTRQDRQYVLDLIDELDLDLEDIGSTIELDPEQQVECNQAVEQAAAAANEDPGYCTWYWDAGWWCYWSTDGSWWYYYS